ncbi:MAG: type II secretion system protein [Gammaproteobacteria bacterium]|nr:type II secretion system protein [Gammaproteobacteria bacterium]
MQRQQGFTLIELVMVIVILGILASFAVPRFADITVDARVSTVRGLEGSIRSAAALAKATAIVQSKAANESISMEGASVAMASFYPTDAATGGITNALADTSGFTVASSGGTLFFTKNGATTPSNCAATYDQQVIGGTAPSISSVTTGC